MGTTVKAIDPDGVVCGATVIHTEGQYGLLACYGDDPTTAEDEGAQAGDVIRLVVDGARWPAVGAAGASRVVAGMVAVGRDRKLEIGEWILPGRGGRGRRPHRLHH